MRKTAERSGQRGALDGMVVAITGGARGIGRATASVLRARGARVAIGDLDEDLAHRTAEELGGEVLAAGLDVTSRESFAAFLELVEHELGPLDVLVNNAGIAPLGEFVKEPDAVTAQLFEVNVIGTVLGCRLALERMLPRSRGAIVNVASALGRIPAPGAVSYTASKHAVVGLTEALRLELEGTGVALHLILPGLAETEMATGVRGPRGVRTQPPAAVAQAIADALASGREEAYVPRSLALLITPRALLPRRTVRLIERLLRLDRMFVAMDLMQRAPYAARIAPPAHDPDPSLRVADAAASVAQALRAADGERRGPAG